MRRWQPEAMRKVNLLLLVIVAIMLGGCSENRVNIAVEYLDAINSRDLATAQALVCPARQDDVSMGLMSVDEADAASFAFVNVSCSARGGDVLCRYTIQQETQSAEVTGVQNPREVIFNFEGDKICGFEEQVTP